MARFCGKCGSPLDPVSGSCPVCNPQQETKPITESERTVAFAPSQAAQKPVYEQPAVPVYSAPQPVSGGNIVQAPAKVGKNNAKPVKGVAALRVTITVLLTICLIFTSLCAYVIYCVRNSISSENLTTITEDVSLTDLIRTAGGAKSLNKFYTRIYNKFYVDINDSDIDNVVSKSSIKSFLIKKASKFANDIFDGDSARIVLKNDEVSRELSKSSSVIMKRTGVNLENYDNLDTLSKMIAGKEQYVVIDTDSSKDVDPIVFEIIKYAFSYITFTVLALLVALILFGMIRNSYTQGLTCAGIVFIVLGGAVTVLAILASTGAIIGSLVGDTVIDTIIGGVLKVNLLPAIIVLVLGILMLSLRFVIKRLVSKKNKAA